MNNNVTLQSSMMSIEIKPGVRIELIRIPEGEFWMGCGTGEASLVERLYREEDKRQEESRRNLSPQEQAMVRNMLMSIPRYDYHCEMPQHTVYLSEFYIAKYVITEEQDYALNNPNSTPSYPKRPQEMYWNRAIKFCQRLSELTGLFIDLPTETQWEKAARGDDKRIYPWGNELPSRKTCSFANNEDWHTDVGKFSPIGDSPYGCSDMAGSISEWTRSLPWKYPYASSDGRENLSSSSERIIRGGDYSRPYTHVRCACRLISNSTRDLNGLRVVATIM